MRTFAVAVLLSSAALAKSEDRTVPSFNSVHVSAGMALLLLTTRDGAGWFVQDRAVLAKWRHHAANNPIHRGHGIHEFLA